MDKKFYVTTAIDYTNDVIHIGHSYQKILADVFARYHRLIGDKTFFLTGTDEHGQKVEKSAKEKGINPQEFVDGKCPLHPTREIQRVEEENYFFRLSKYQEFLEDLLKEGSTFVVPDNKRKEVLSFVKKGLKDFSV